MDKAKEREIENLFNLFNRTQAISLFKKQVEANEKLSMDLEKALIKQGPYVKERRDMFTIECMKIRGHRGELYSEHASSVVQMADALIAELDKLSDKEC